MCMKQNYLANITLASSTNWTSNVTSDPYPLTQHDKAGFVFSWTSLVGTLTTTSFDIEVSNDATNWATQSSAVSVGTNATGVDAVSLTDLEFNYVRVKANIGSVTSGAFLVTATLKR